MLFPGIFMDILSELYGTLTGIVWDTVGQYSQHIQDVWDLVLRDNAGIAVY